MTDSQPTSKKLIQVAELAGVEIAGSVNAEGIAIIGEPPLGAHDMVALDYGDAVALRDWLNTAIPASTHEPCVHCDAYCHCSMPVESADSDLVCGSCGAPFHPASAPPPGALRDGDRVAWEGHQGRVSDGPYYRVIWDKAVGGVFTDYVHASRLTKISDA